MVKGSEYIITDEYLAGYTAYLAVVRNGDKRILEDGILRTALEADVIETISKLNRPYSVLEGVFSIDGIMLKTHCPLDGHKYEVADAQ